MVSRSAKSSSRASDDSEVPAAAVVTREPATVPSTRTVHSILAFVQLLHGANPLVGKLGLRSTNPILFATVREVLSALVLLALAAVWEGALSRQLLCHRNVWRAGFALFVNQAFFIIGVKVSNPVVGAAWQPAQPLFSLILAAAMGVERLTLPKAAGLSLAALGAAFLVLAEAEAADGGAVLFGSVCFALNCFGAALYVLAVKPLLAEAGPVTVTGLAYASATCEPRRHNQPSSSESDAPPRPLNRVASTNSNPCAPSSCQQLRC